MKYFTLLALATITLIGSPAWAEKPPELSGAKVGGYFDTEFVATNDTAVFKAHRFILNVQQAVSDRVDFYSEIEFEYGALVNAGDNSGEIKIEQAWVDYEIFDAHYGRAGIFLIPVSRVNIYHDSDLREATHRPIYAKYIVPSTWMDAGFQVYGSRDVGDTGELGYSFSASNGLSSDGTNNSISGKNGIRKTRPNFKTDNNKALGLTGRVTYSPSTKGTVGLSVYRGAHNAAGTQDITLVAGDATYKLGPVEFIGEYGAVTVEQTGDNLSMNGYYLEGRYRFFPEFLQNTFLADGFDHPLFTAFARYGQVDTDTGVTNEFDRTQTTIGINYRPETALAYKVEYEINQEAENESDNNAFVASVALGF